MDEKYRLSDEETIIRWVPLYRIIALKDFGNVKKGDIGGYVKSENNLSQEGDCWIYNDAIVGENAYVSENASISDNAIVSGNAKVFGNSFACSEALITDNSRVSGNSFAYGSSEIRGNAIVVNGVVYGGANVNRNLSTDVIHLNDRIYSYTLTDNHIKVGCKTKSISKWKEWLDGDEEFETRRSDSKFLFIKASIEYLINVHRIRESINDKNREAEDIDK